MVTWKGHKHVGIKMGDQDVCVGRTRNKGGGWGGSVWGRIGCGLAWHDFFGRFLDNGVGAGDGFSFTGFLDGWRAVNVLEGAVWRVGRLLVVGAADCLVEVASVSFSGIDFPKEPALGGVDVLEFFEKSDGGDVVGRCWIGYVAGVWTSAEFFSRVPREENGVKVIVGWLGFDSIMHGVEEGMIGRIVGVGDWDELVLELECGIGPCSMKFKARGWSLVVGKILRGIRSLGCLAWMRVGY